MKEKPKTVFVKGATDWHSKEFRLLKDGDVFSFDQEQIFTASCDSYVIENDGMHSVLTVNKEVESFLQERKLARGKKYYL